MNDFGGYVGGPITIPHLYNGKDKTFFFFSYEGLRLAKETPIVTTVPTDAMRAGDVSGWLDTREFRRSTTHTAPPRPDSLPINPVSANFMNYFMPRTELAAQHLCRQLPDQLPHAYQQ